MSDAVYRSVYDSLKRSIVHTSTFSENALSMRAGLATLDVLENERPGRARRWSWANICAIAYARSCRDYEMVQEVRGLGMLSGIEFQPPSQLRLRVPFRSVPAHSSRHVRAGGRDAAVPRLEHSDPDVR